MQNDTQSNEISEGKCHICHVDTCERLLRYTFILHPPPPAGGRWLGRGRRRGVAALWGDVLCRNICRRGWRGRITDGERGRRDASLPELKALECAGNAIWRRRRRISSSARWRFDLGAILDAGVLKRWWRSAFAYGWETKLTEE